MKCTLADFCEHKYALASQGKGRGPARLPGPAGRRREHSLSSAPESGGWGAACGGSDRAAGGVGDGWGFFPPIFQDVILQNRELWLLIKKKFGFHSKSQYRNWQKKLAEDCTWPPTNKTDYSGDGKNGSYVNRGYESPEQIPRGKLRWGGGAPEQHFWTRL